MKNFNDIKNRINHLRSLKKLTADKKRELSNLEIYLESATIQTELSGKVRTRSTYGQKQTRSTGPRGVRNEFGHAIGTIGAAIDTIVTNSDLNGRYSKNEIAARCGTKISKVNSHIRNELVKKFGYDFKVNASGKLVTIFPKK